VRKARRMLELLEREKGHHDSPLTVEQNGISVAFVDFWYIERERERDHPCENWAAGFTSMGEESSFLAIRTQKLRASEH